MNEVERRRTKAVEVKSIEERIIEAIRKKSGFRIIDLAKQLGLWDSNLRKRIKVLVQKGVLETYVHGNYLCVRIRNENQNKPQ